MNGDCYQLPIAFPAPVVDGGWRWMADGKCDPEMSSKQLRGDGDHLPTAC